VLLVDRESGNFKMFVLSLVGPADGPQEVHQKQRGTEWEDTNSFQLATYCSH
jgi:hypothetical protein